MPVLLDANLGDADFAAAGANTRTLTTIATAAAGTRIVVFISYFSTSTVTGVSDGTAYTLDKAVVNGSDKFEIWSRNAAGGLASGSSITATFGATITGGTLMGAASFTGVASSSAVVTTSSATGTAASWSSGSGTNTGQADAAYVGGAGNEDVTNPTTSTPSSGTEINDRYRPVDQQGFATGYKAVSTVASDAVTGTWSNSASTANTGALVIYAAAATASSPPPTQQPLLFTLGPPFTQLGPPLLAFTASDAPDVLTPVADSDSGTGTDAATVSATLSDSDAGTGTDSASVSVTTSSSDTGAGTDSATVSATLSSSDSATGTDDATVNVPVAASDSGTGTDSASTTATLPGSDTGTGSESSTISTTGSGSDTGTGTDGTSISATLTSSDTATGTDDASVADITGGPTPVSDTDSGTVTETAQVADITPVVVPPVQEPEGGGAFFDEDARFGRLDFREVTDSDSGLGFEQAFVTDLTPAPVVEPLRLPTFIKRRLPITVREYGNATDLASVHASSAVSDEGRAVEAATVVDVGLEGRLEGEEEQLILGLLGLL